MSTISNLGGRWPALYTGQQNGNRPGAVQKTQDASPAIKSGGALDLDKRVAAVGNATVDFAQDFVSSFTQALFGDDAKGAVIDFDSASLETSSSYAVGYQHTEGANGVTDAAAFSLSDSSHFIGKGTITTADGRKFDFEVEVQYNYELNAAASQTSSLPAPEQDSDKPSTKDLPSVQLPNIDFPGTLADLFKLIGRDLHTALSSNDDNSKTAEGIDRNTLRSLSLRLLNLVDSKDANTYAPPSSADKAKAAASAGETQADSDAPVASDTPAATETPAAADAAAAPAADDAASPDNTAA
ncbi:hypothetical protein SAMN05216319_1899 [Duganella sp. CF402]|uniref:hypothetical protein n=1 Tax=unclassified Duganella TaxID=2636909 RepID=UPI0008D075C6|nr:MULTISPECIES: hypothetical protein [unclassified Duganella]RZT09663.1 hypothetical protein EV582_1727 [Duganella sp. BK701]SEL48083.1 hypothetical protein SAMN05216319_1899 [Duganella sp. CF402]